MRRDSILRLSRQLVDQVRGEFIYHGRILIYRNIPDLESLLMITDQMLREAFEPLLPETAHFNIGRDEYLAIVEKLRASIERNAEINKLFANVLAQTGMKIESNYCDRLRLRINPNENIGTVDGRIGAVGAHRDTWASNIQQQTNWWVPVYRTRPDNTIIFYPDYWGKPLANTSSSWDFKELLIAQKKLQLGKPEYYPPLPQAIRPPDSASEVKLVLEPGEILCFSGAHLHASVPNTSGVARFNFEMRTVNINDIRRNHGAPNIDADGANVMYQWFRNMLTGEMLDAVLQSSQ